MEQSSVDRAAYVADVGRRARAASREMARAPCAAKDRALLGNRKYDTGEKLGDLVLAAEQPVGDGLILAFGDTSGGARRMIQIVFGLSIAFAASSFFLSFFSFGGGALV